MCRARGQACVQCAACCRARVKAGIQLTAEESSTLIESLTTQALYTNEPLTPQQLAALVDKVKTDDVNRVCTLY